MKQLTAFTKKEFLEQLRTGKIMILGILFCLFGIMNPAIAKMTPWLFELMSEQLSESGMVIAEMKVDALTSWTQFFKNMPILLIVFIVMLNGILTAEYQKGTLINVITKGLKRWKVLISKLVMMAVLWTVGYLITFGVTYGYNAYFWDNRIVQNLVFAVWGYYLAGLWLITVLLLASAVTRTSSAVTLSVGAAFAVSYLLGLIPEIKKYVPTFLMSSNELMAGTLSSKQCLAAVGITAFLTAVNIFLSIVFFNKKVI
ncbi:MAG: ABC transporter permease subunit [Lachnospiraceae bacterium]|nr:ABC transporter permease subunit [Lachnospiraceae bacterium]